MTGPGNRIRGGVKVFSDEYNELSVFVQYDTQSFYNSRTGNNALSRLDNRYSSLFSGINYNFKSQYGIFNISGMTDVLGVNNGTIVDASYAFPLVFAHVALVPAAGLKYADSAYNDYYYGISHSESRKSHLSEYSPIYSFSPYVGVTANIPVFDRPCTDPFSRASLKI